MTTTYNPPRILILLIQIERDHLNNWQALLAVLPFNGHWSGARSIQRAKGISGTIPQSLFRALCGFCTAIAVQGQRATGWGQASAPLARETARNSTERAAAPAFRGAGSPLQPPRDMGVREGNPEPPLRAGTALRCHARGDPA